MSDAAHRQTRYVAADPLPDPVALPVPAPTRDIDQARSDLTETGMCILADALSGDQLKRLRDTLDAQAEGERALGDLAPPGANTHRQLVSNLVNKGQVFLDLIEREETDLLAGYLLGKHFLVSSMTGGTFHGPTDEPQALHRDQGQVPATADFPAACNLFWCLDDFTPEAGSTHIIPGSHRWAPEHLINPPAREMSVQVEIPAGSVFSWEGRLWHGAGANRDGSPRRHIANYYCLPWMRQQENWGVTCLQDVIDNASPRLRARLGMRTYGTLGMMSGTRVDADSVSLGNYDVVMPEYIIGEGAALHKVRRPSREDPS
tara:strand:- start:1094 stop:2044 length:951 start_codon:yes stop_codon:yes gene_type:complete